MVIGFNVGIIILFIIGLDIAIIVGYNFDCLYQIIIVDVGTCAIGLICIPCSIFG